MSVSSVSDPAQGLAQFFQRIQSDRQAQSAGTDTATANVASSSDSSTASAAAQAAPVARAHHHHGGGGAMRGKIESAVTDALKNYDGSGDVNKVIQDAVKAAVQSGSQSADQTSTTAAAPATPTDPSTTAASQSHDAFQQLLSSHGVDASQFRDDIFAGFKSARGNETESSGALTALPSGSYVDTEG